MLIVLNQQPPTPVEPTVSEFQELHNSGSKTVVMQGGLVVNAAQNKPQPAPQRVSLSNYRSAVEPKVDVKQQPTVKSQGAQLFVNGKERKITKSSRYLLDMMTLEDE